MADNPITAPVTAYAPGTPAPTVPVELTSATAWAEWDLLKSDKAWVERWTNGDVAAKQKYDELVAARAGHPRPEPPPVREPTREEMSTLITVEQMSPQAQARFEADFGAPKDPTAYKLKLPAYEQSDTQAAQTEANFRGWLHTAQVPLNVASYLSEQLAQDAERYAPMTDEQRSAESTATNAKLERMWGPAGAKQKLALVQRLVDETEKARPGLKSWMAQTGLGNSFMLIAQLYPIAARRYGTAAPAPVPSAGEQAQDEINRLFADQAFRTRFLNNEPVAKAEIDRLQRIKVGIR